jgi:hypothetical protein
MQRTLRGFALVVAICFLGATSLFSQAQKNYLLRADGDVRVNGVAVPSSAIVSPGDLIETSKGSVAKIAAPGVSLLVPENSRVSVKMGTLAVNNLTPASSHSSGLLGGPAVSFEQLSLPATSNVCRTAKTCSCKTAKSCSNTAGF